MKSKRVFLISILLLSDTVLLLGGCLHNDHKDERFYFEPPSRIIQDYTGMMEDDVVNWAWLKLGLRLRSYPNITLVPFKNVSLTNDKGIANELYQGLREWLQKGGLILSEDGELVLEGGIVECRLERRFFNKINPFYDKQTDLFLEVELVAKENTTFDVVWKIRHGVTGPDVNTLKQRMLKDLINYFELHK